MLITQLTRACMRAAEADAQLDEWGVMCPEPLMVESPRNLFMTAYPKMVEILQLLGSSSFMLTPTQADFKGPLADHIEQYLATDNTAAKDRVKLFRLAWDIAGTSFGTRQALYQRFFASDPLTRRVRQMQTGINWAEEPVSRISHLLANIQLVEVNPSAAEPAEVSVRCRFLVYRNRVETETDILVGKREDLLRRVEGGWQITRRKILLDQNVLLSKNLTFFF